MLSMCCSSYIAAFVVPSNYSRRVLKDCFTWPLSAILIPELCSNYNNTRQIILGRLPHLRPPLYSHFLGLEMAYFLKSFRGTLHKTYHLEVKSTRNLKSKAVCDILFPFATGNVCHFALAEGRERVQWSRLLFEGSKYHWITLIRDNIKRRHKSSSTSDCAMRLLSQDVRRMSYPRTRYA